jgi:hypothetical protein
MLPREMLTKDLIPIYLKSLNEQKSYEEMGVKPPQEVTDRVSVVGRVLGERIGPYGVRKMTNVKLGGRLRVM